jgi:hypothetical protein
MFVCQVHFLLIHICNFHVLNHLLLINIRKLHWNQATIQSTGKSKQQALASRLVSLSEEVRTHKLVVLQQRRQIAVLRQEKKHLQGLLVTMESDVEHLEEGKIIAETKGNLLLISI